jgi:sulfatase modifying factor 1
MYARYLSVRAAGALFSLLLAFAADVSAITVDTVPVGNPGNAPDPTTGYGSVPYTYNIGTYDVTIGQYAAFLNAVAAVDPYGLYTAQMSTDLNAAGIARSGSSGSYSYSAIGSPNKPVTYVNWGDAARFANWIGNGQPVGEEGAGTTETGSYTLNGATSSIDLYRVTRNANATWFIPSENEWYKAAYYNPSAASYYQYPFASNNEPVSTVPGHIPNTGNFYSSNTGYALTGSTVLSTTQNYLTDVGAYTASASPSGSFDMGGDVLQWTEGSTELEGRSLRGGSFYFSSLNLLSANRLYADSTFQAADIGFRLANFPAATLPGDVNFDGIVNGQDLAEIAANWLSTGFAIAGDANHDGIVNGQDISVMAANWLSTTDSSGTGSAVPKPSTLVLAALGGLALLVYRLRHSRSC